MYHVETGRALAPVLPKFLCLWCNIAVVVVCTNLKCTYLENNVITILTSLNYASICSYASHCYYAQNYASIIYVLIACDYMLLSSCVCVYVCVCVCMHVLV